MSSGIRQVKKMSMETLNVASTELWHRSNTRRYRSWAWTAFRGTRTRDPTTAHTCTWEPLDVGNATESDETLVGRAACLLGLCSRLGNDWKEDGISTSTSNTFREKLLCRLSCAGFYNSPFSISHVRKKMFLLLKTAQRISFMHYSTTSMQINQRNVYS